MTRILAAIGLLSLAAVVLLAIFGVALYRTGRAEVAAWTIDETDEAGA